MWLGCAAAAIGRAYAPPGHHIFAGLTGGTSIVPYEHLVGRHPPVFEIYMTWDTATSWLAPRDSSFRSRLGLEVGTSTGYGRAGVITPQQIALGRSDWFLIQLNHNLAHSRRIVYVRLMSEMNGYWNAYAGFSADGSSRGGTHSPHAYIQAWRRSVLILRGGPISQIDRRLHALRLPAVRVSGLRKLPRPKLAFLWVPQDEGSPDIPANAPGNYWPGGAYVDWVGTDFYSSYPNFSLLDRFYDEFKGKPFVLSEWALYGSDNPGFVRTLFSWVRSHPRVRMLNYYQGFGNPSKASLVHYPRSRRALHRELASRQFMAYPPEYAHPKRKPHHGRPPPEVPPHPPSPGTSPSPPSGPPVPVQPGPCSPLPVCPPEL